MDFIVSKEITDKTKCTHNFICLSGEVCPGCEVLSPIGAKFVFIKAKKNASLCIYITNYGGAYICNCPTRNEIYRKYGK